MRLVTVPPYHLMTMNEALLGWLMTPGAPDGTLTLEDFLRRPPWHQQAAWWGRGGHLVRAQSGEGTVD